MKLIGNLKKKVENAQTKEEARDAIKKAGMLLDDELEAVSGGGGFIPNSFADYDSICQKNSGGPHVGVIIRGLYCCERCHKICKDKSPQVQN